MPDLTDDPGKNTTEMFPTSLALRALVEGYFVLQASGVDTASLSRHYRSAIFKAAEWVAQHTASATDLCINYRAFGIYGLAAAYRFSRNVRYLNIAAQQGEFIAGVQKDGYWPAFNEGDRTEDGQFAVFHESIIYYHGITLRGLAELAAIMPDSMAAKAKIKTAALSSLQYIIEQRLAGGQKETIGQLWKYPAKDIGNKAIAAKSNVRRGDPEVFLACCYVWKYLFSPQDSDRVKVARLLNGMFLRLNEVGSYNTLHAVAFYMNRSFADKDFWRK